MFFSFSNTSNSEVPDDDDNPSIKITSASLKMAHSLFSQQGQAMRTKQTTYRCSCHCHHSGVIVPTRQYFQPDYMRYALSFGLGQEASPCEYGGEHTQEVLAPADLQLHGMEFRRTTIGKRKTTIQSTDARPLKAHCHSEHTPFGMPPHKSRTTIRTQTIENKTIHPGHANINVLLSSAKGYMLRI